MIKSHRLQSTVIKKTFFSFMKCPLIIQSDKMDSWHLIDSLETSS